MLRISVAFIACLPVLIYGITNPKQCLNGAPLPDAIRISDCYPCAPCKFELGTAPIIEIDFTARNSLSSLYTRVLFQSYGFTGELQLPDDQARVCDRLLANLPYCPLDPGENVTYVLDFHLDEVFPETELTLEFSIEEYFVPILCFSINVQTYRKK